MDKCFDGIWEFFLTYIVERFVPVFSAWRHWDEIDAWGNLLFNLKFFGAVTLIFLAYYLVGKWRAARQVGKSGD